MALGWRKEYARYKTYFLNIYAVYNQRRDIKMFLEIILSLAAVSLFSLLALKPTVLTVSGLLKEIKVKEETLTKMNKKILNLRNAQDLTSKEITKISLLPGVVPDTPSPEKFVRQIEGLSAKHSAKILSLTIGEVTLIGKQKEVKNEKNIEPLPESAKELSFSISLTGEYDNLSSFLDDLQLLRRPVKIDIANFNLSEGVGGVNLIFTVSGRVPYLGQ